jgi:hypothetical protein
VRSACDSERPTTVTHGQSWSLGGDTRESDQSAFALVRTLRTSPKLVVRGRVELPTFRFSGREASGSRASGRSECSGHASSSLLDCLGRGMAAIDEDGEEPGNDHQRKPNCGSPGH